MSTSTLPKFELAPDKENEISFKLSIDGSSSEGVVPQFRFVFVDRDTKLGFFVPCRKDGDIVTVCLPVLPKELVGPSKVFHGKLEVVIGNVLVVPTELILQFVQPLRVEAVVISQSKSSIESKSSTVAAVEHVSVNQNKTQTEMRKPVNEQQQQEPMPQQTKVTAQVKPSDRKTQNEAALARLLLLKRLKTMVKNSNK